MQRTPQTDKHAYVAYMTKHMRKDLRARLRMQAIVRNTSMEDVLNRVLEVGLPIVEKSAARDKTHASN